MSCVQFRENSGDLCYFEKVDKQSQLDCEGACVGLDWCVGIQMNTSLLLHQTATANCEVMGNAEHSNCNLLELESTLSVPNGEWTVRSRECFDKSYAYQAPERRQLPKFSERKVVESAETFLFWGFWLVIIYLLVKAVLTESIGSAQQSESSSRLSLREKRLKREIEGGPRKPKVAAPNPLYRIVKSIFSNVRLVRSKRQSQATRGGTQQMTRRTRRRAVRRAGERGMGGGGDNSIV
jgi:hypothetical protein